jgi:hypothetical protein
MASAFERIGEPAPPVLLLYAFERGGELALTRVSPRRNCARLPRIRAYALGFVMRTKNLLISLILGALAVTAPIACGGGGGGSSAASSGPGSGGGGGEVNPGCTLGFPVSYDACSGTTFFPDGSCAGGSCAAGDLEKKVYAAWRAEALSISGLSEADFDKRVFISTVELSAGPRVRVEYVVVLDWARSRQADTIDLMGASSTPTDPEIQKAVELGIESAEWTGLGAIGSIAAQSQVASAFEGCQCGMLPDWCHIDFLNVSGTLHVRAFKELDASKNECLDADVDVSAGAQLSCNMTPCEIN